MRKTSTRKTNVQLVEYLMEHSRYGVLSQLVIMEGITRYARECSEAKAEEMETGLISGEAWKAAATEIYEALEAHFKQ